MTEFFIVNENNQYLIESSKDKGQIIRNPQITKFTNSWSNYARTKTHFDDNRFELRNQINSNIINIMTKELDIILD